MRSVLLLVACCVGVLVTGCGGSTDEHAAATAVIIVDGDGSDWGQTTYFKPIFRDPQGDAEGVGPGGDIIAVYVAYDAANIYVRVDVAGGPPPPTLSMGVGFSVSQHQGMAVGDKFLVIEFQPLSCSAWIQNAGGGTSELGVGDVAIHGNIIEMSVRRQDLAPSSPSYVEAWIYMVGSDDLFDNAGSAAVIF